MKLDGYILIRDEADGALPNGTRVIKVNSLTEDGHKDGDVATVIGSHTVPKFIPGASPDGSGGYVYCVEWDDMPGLPVMVTARRIRKRPLTEV